MPDKLDRLDILSKYAKISEDELKILSENLHMWDYDRTIIP